MELGMTVGSLPGLCPTALMGRGPMARGPMAQPASAWQVHDAR